MHSDKDIEDAIEQGISMFRSVKSHETFERFYRVELSNRLLHSSSVNDDLELTVMEKLIQECGKNYTKNISIMFEDVKRKVDDKFKYKDVCPTYQAGITIVTSGTWPFTKQDFVKVPKQILSFQNHFKKYYSDIHRKRKLEWIYSEAQCTLSSYLNSKFDIETSQTAGLILLQFNNVEVDERISYNDIKTELNFDDQLMSAIKMLCHPKHPILLEHKDETLSPVESSEFSLNSGYKTNQKLVVISKLNIEESNEESVSKTKADAKIMNSVYEDRKNIVLATISKIMKAYKILEKSELFKLALGSCLVPLDMPLFESTCETLLNRDIIRASTEKRDSYVYNPVTF